MARSSKEGAPWGDVRRASRHPSMRSIVICGARGAGQGSAHSSLEFLALTCKEKPAKNQRIFYTDGALLSNPGGPPACGGEKGWRVDHLGSPLNQARPKASLQRNDDAWGSKGLQLAAGLDPQSTGIPCRPTTVNYDSTRPTE